MIAPAAAAQVPPALVAAVPGADLRGPGLLPGAPGPVPPDLAGWAVVGGVPAAPPPAGGVRLAGNATLVSPPVAVPAEAQTLSVTAASGSGALLEVRARLEPEGAEVELGVVAPAAGGAPRAVPVAAVAGRTVRIVLDPSAALGGAVDVREVGPLAAPLPGWAVAAGTPSRVIEGRRPALEVREDPLALRAPAVTGDGLLRGVLVAARGPGVVRVRAGGRWRVHRLGGTWRDVRADVPPGARRVVLEVRADPEGDRLVLRDLGLLVRRPRPAVRAVLRGRRLTVTGTLGPAGGRLPVTVRDRGRRIAVARATAAGAFRVRVAVRSGRVRAVLEVGGDRTRDAVRVTLRPRPSAAPR